MELPGIYVQNIRTTHIYVLPYYYGCGLAEEKGKHGWLEHINTHTHTLAHVLNVTNVQMKYWNRQLQ